MRTVWLIAVAITSCVACNSNKNSSAWSTKPSATPNAAAATSTPAPASSSSGMGIGSVTSRVELASLDESKEDAGAKQHADDIGHEEPVCKGLDRISHGWGMLRQKQMAQGKNRSAIGAPMP